MATDVQAPDAALLERERMISAIREHEADLRALGVSRLWLFGSVARGDPGRRSDVDVLISAPPAMSFRCSTWPGCGSSCASCSAATPMSSFAKTCSHGSGKRSGTISSRCSDAARPKAAVQALLRELDEGGQDQS